MDAETIKNKFDEHDKKLEKHDEKFEKLETNDGINKTRIDNLCKSLDDLVDTLKEFKSTFKWIAGYFMTGLILLIVYFIEQLATKL